MNPLTIITCIVLSVGILSIFFELKIEEENPIKILKSTGMNMSLTGIMCFLFWLISITL